MLFDVFIGIGDFGKRLCYSHPPSQPSLGPDGTNYPYAAVSSYGPFNDSGCGVSSPSCNEGLTYYIYQPASPTPSGPIPLVLFLHGWGADNPNSYYAWIDQIVQKGYTVVYPTYDNGPSQAGDDVVNNEMVAFQDAITRIQGNTTTYVQPAVSSHGVIDAAVTGHSAGGFTAFRVADLSWVTGSVIPPIRSITAFNPGQGQLTFSDFDLSAIDSSVLALIVVSSGDTSCHQYDGAKLYDALTMISSTDKNFLEAFSDSHGSPALVADHYWPVTSPPTYPIDAMDFFGTYKLSVAMVNCTFGGTNCTFALGAGNTSQTYMGTWSDSVAVTPLSYFTTDPELTFPYPGGTCTE